MVLALDVARDVLSGTAVLHDAVRFLLVTAVAAAGIAAIARRVRRRKTARRALESAAFVEMMDLLGLERVGAGALGYDPPALLDKPLLIGAVAGNTAGRDAAVHCFMSMRGSLRFVTVGVMRLRRPLPTVSVRAINPLLGRVVKKVRLHGERDFVDQSLRDWVANQARGLDFAVAGSLLTVQADGFLTAGNLRPLIATMSEFADRIER